MTTTLQASMILLFLMTLLCASCSDNKTKKQPVFVFPEIVDTLETATHYYSPTDMIIPSNLIKTIQKIGNKADLLDTMYDYNPFIKDDYLSDTSKISAINNESLSIYIDTTREVSFDIYERAKIAFFYNYFPENEHKTKTQKIIDSVSFEVRRQAWEENKTLVKSLPVYIVNQTNQPIKIADQDGRVMLIQEAMDKNGLWKPIEVWQFSECGNSYSDVILRPEYYLMFKIIKYKGPFETLLRLKMANNKEIYYSQPFRGSINLSQIDTSHYKKKF